MKPRSTILPLLFAVCLGMNCYSQQTTPRDDKSQTNNSSLSGALEVTASSNPPQDDSQADKPARITVENIRDAAPHKDGWDFAIFWIQVLLALIALIGGRWAYRTVKATEIAAYAARDANERAVKAERAWLIVTKAELVGNKPGEPGTVYIQCAVKNIGKTHARILGIKAILRVGPINVPGKSRDDSQLQREPNWTPQWAIFPEKTSALHSPTPSISGTAGEILRTIVAPGETQFIHGTVYYWDAFTETDRISTFCFRNFDRDQFGKVSIGFHPIGEPEVNRQT